MLLPLDTIRPAWLTRETVLALVLLGLTLICFIGCLALLAPFFPALTWAITLAVVAAPVNRELAHRTRSRTGAALLAVLLIALLLIIPGSFLFIQAVKEGIGAVDWVRREFDPTSLARLGNKPLWLRPLIERAISNLDLGATTNRVAGMVAGYLSSMLASSVRVFTTMFIASFALFFFFRDSGSCITAVRKYAPLSDEELDIVLPRIADVIHATIYGKFAASAAQGLLGGLAFWFLGLPAPLLWGCAMGMISLIPVLGPPLIWAPAAIVLAQQGHWGKAIILAAWGTLVVGLVDNLLYPILVGDRLRMHPLVIFFSVFGGVVLFGFSGLVLGPLTIAVTIALVEVWRLRTSNLAQSP